MWLVDREQSTLQTVWGEGAFAIWTAARILCLLLFALCFLEQEKGFLNSFGEGRLQPVQAVVQVELCIVAEWVHGVVIPSQLLKSYCRVVSLSGP